MTPAWHALRAETIASDGVDAWIDLLAREHANALIERARLQTLVRGSLEYDGANARALQARLCAEMGR